MQDSVFTCLGLIILLVVLLPFALMISNARKIKALQSTLQKLSERTARLEAQLMESARPRAEGGGVTGNDRPEGGPAPFSAGPAPSGKEPARNRRTALGRTGVRYLAHLLRESDRILYDV